MVPSDPSIHYLLVVPFLDGLFQENTSTKSAGDKEQQVYTSHNAIAESVGRRTAGFHSPQRSHGEHGDDEQQVSTPHNAIAESAGRRTAGFHSPQRSCGEWGTKRKGEFGRLWEIIYLYK